ncbi:hypothetical protein MEO39_12185 [Dolichospermum sp. ST_sed2]|nr:hypothetical protein [Dolichospermum sp. ST_sed8]MDD1455558.1 hypothetical protein [Dolichospermum sp. ST_sed7]MDD1460841.1 hypothetical protein [Dolichospermum sp. ST_sed2]MDD1467321.1 hypothetical protein [Dolichospermum sp. ST_sed5]MDD1470593.1 hypothetical protein [Dolichospermum sp. ST_sed4]
MNSEASLKPAIRKLIHSSQVKPEAVQVIVEGLENKEIKSDYWETLFNKEGADIAIKQKIYSPQMVRLMTLRAMVIPETLPQFLEWLNIQAGKKPDESQTVSLEFQKGIRALFPKEQIAEGIRYLLLNLLNKKISVDSLSWLLMIDGSVWGHAQKEFIADVRYDLQLIDNYFIRQYQNGLSDNFFKFQKQVWTSLINNWRNIQQRYYKGEEYQPFAELFEKFQEYDLAAYFYQVSQSNVSNDLFYNIAYEKYLRLNPNGDKLSKVLFYEVAYQEYRNSNIVVYGLLIKRKPTFIEFIINFVIQGLISPSINFTSSLIKNTIEFLVDLIKWIFTAIIWLVCISMGLAAFGFGIQNFGVFFIIFIFYLIAASPKK